MRRAASISEAFEDLTHAPREVSVALNPLLHAALRDPETLRVLPERGVADYLFVAWMGIVQSHSEPPPSGWKLRFHIPALWLFGKDARAAQAFLRSLDENLRNEVWWAVNLAIRPGSPRRLASGGSRMTLRQDLRLNANVIARLIASGLRSNPAYFRHLAAGGAADEFLPEGPLDVDEVVFLPDARSGTSS